MKVIFSKQSKRLIKNFILLFIIGVILLNAVGYFLDLQYISVFASARMINKFEVRSKLLMEAMNKVGVCSPEEAAKVWASGLMQRSAALQYSVMTKNLKDEYAKQLEKSFPNWVTGMSSPWVNSFEITKTETPDNNNYIFHLKFSTLTSTGPAGDYNAVVTVTREDSFWRIIKINTDEQLYPYTGFM